jgi:hypothetical protein
MRMLWVLLLAPFFAQQCWAGSIGLYANSDGSGCSISIPQGSNANIYAVGMTAGSDPYGGIVDSGEFRVVGLPADWFAGVVPAAGVTPWNLADLVGDGAGFSVLPYQSGIFPLFTITIVATSDVQNVVLQVVKHVNGSPPFGVPQDCPWFHYNCGDPCDTGGTCVEGVPIVINGPCTVAVSQATWSTVRELYR